MEIKDLAGLSEPLKKLIEVVSQGLGALSKPYLIRKTADAKAYEIKAISDAIKDNHGNLKEIGYSEEKLSLMSLDSESIKNELAIEERTKNRIEYKEQKRQKNIENITQNAVKNLEAETNVSEEPVDEDWTTRFFNYAEDVSNDEMQDLWGRILAGEIKQPNSFSLRTLELIRNLTKIEAQVFTKAANFVISSWNSPFLFKGKNEDSLANYGFSFEDQLLLTEIGIIQAETNISRRLSKQDNDSILYFESGNKIIKTSKKANTPEHRISILRFSKIGVELLKLITPTVNDDYLKEFCLSLETVKIDTEYAFILSKNNGQIQHTEPWVKYKKEE
ncbi:DUF2806 domain-containing protein [Psychroserpens sp. NJDZ02]|uniref:DUF2806 domain-containing protein n=1 Tax=Psychroserpens sp. NJDZ02 TaxID=2570561 RepID=UPI0010A75C5F|nr:DUF2806 domain-containing protein [Psychroserpens sp. NJDZ02]QCE40894.1 DUF2806 domain-containing protein [Psychroserpens sp. NJDZ02]